ncbi:ABC transporter permease [Actinocrispum wychmicini]|uniref:NitT/TauT family transport system permease protein n=1 Tax=Actinocrispum wychmicini TaxID=1213861 RepID=A0A4R2JQ74_9PSEU|nr:ABC transporter permease [Actinocrispum wychmicini]TCO62363.1 NitT/TauT family transport system permease protein [Actinocrispum wychmicini]
MKPVAVEHEDLAGWGVKAPPVRSARRDRQDWRPLPERRRPRRSPKLLPIRTPISAKGKWVLYVLSFAIPLAAWFVLSEAKILPPEFLPTPEATFSKLVELAQSGQLWPNLWATSERVIYGFAIAIVISVPLGFMMGTFQAAQALFEPIISLVRYLPVPAFIPLLIIWLNSVDEPPKIALIALAVVFFNTFMIADVVKSVPMPMINVSYTLGARRGEVLRRVILPHALPGMIDAIRVNLAAAWNFVIVAEEVNAATGLGHEIMQAQRFLRTNEIFAVLIVIGLVGLVLDVALRLLRGRVGRWVV